MKKALLLHKKLGGKLAVVPKVSINKDNLPLIYSPGVADAVREISKKPQAVYDLTIKNNTVAVITDGSAVLGLGNVGPEAALPVMEGKCAIFKVFADVNAFPICLRTQDVEEIVATIKNIAPTFGAICLEDISAPRCFVIEEKLQDLGIPVIHDDQHATAIVILAALYNGLRVVNKKLSDAKIVIVGSGAAGIAAVKLILKAGAKNILVVDSKGILSRTRHDLNPYKQQLAALINKESQEGGLKEAAKGADVLIGLSTKGLFTQEVIKSMNKNPVVFALANPDPEVLPTDAKKWGAKIVATGRSDFPNQINNALVFPGLFNGLLKNWSTKLTSELEIRVAKALSSLIKKPSTTNIVPSIFDKRVVQMIVKTVNNS